MHGRQQHDKGRNDGNEQAQAVQPALEQGGIEVLPPCERRNGHGGQQHRNEQVKHGSPSRRGTPQAARPSRSTRT